MGAEPIARAWWWLVAVSTLLLVGVTLSRAHLPMDAPPSANDAADVSGASADGVPPAASDAPAADAAAADDGAATAAAAQPGDPAAPADEGSGALGADDEEAEGSGAPETTAEEEAAPPPTREGTAAEPCSFRLNRATVARNVEQREPVDATGPFPADGSPLFVFIDADNRGDEASDHATVRWIHRATGGVWSNRARLGRNHRWRTWVDRVLPATRVGAWQAQIIDDQGCLLRTLDFEVIPHGW